MIKIVQALCALGERQGPTAIKAANIITNELKKHGIAYTINPIKTYLPKASSTLMVDGVLVDSAPTSFVGGKIGDNTGLSSSRIPSRYLIDVPNINFNPTSKALSLSNFYFAPSLAVRRGDVPRILEAKQVKGVVRVRKAKYVLPQILVGNLRNPSTIIFTHFDSIGPGAIDNASGTAVCLALVTKDSNILKKALIVFDPNEEVSYDYPTYWGHGYREFEKKYPKLLRCAKRIISVDSVGNGKPEVIRDPKVLNLAFPVRGLKALLPKTLTIAGDIEKMMEVYQSEADLPQLLSERYLEGTRKLVLSQIR